MPDHLYELCFQCWAVNDDDRPVHDEINSDLDEIMQEIMLLPDCGERPANFGLKTTLHRGSSNATLRDASLSNDIPSAGQKTKLHHEHLSRHSASTQGSPAELKEPHCQDPKSPGVKGGSGQHGSEEPALTMAAAKTAASDAVRDQRAWQPQVPAARGSCPPLNGLVSLPASPITDAGLFYGPGRSSPSPSRTLSPGTGSIRRPPPL